MRIAADKQTAVGALVLSLMFVRCDQGEPALTTPWGLRGADIVWFTDTVNHLSDVAQKKVTGLIGSDKT